ncbi:MAG: tetratricopeptide repeat protein [Rhodobacteraceae bacterium]|nr:tetratricopeptide repeat protein [Paracoccaceae bacterium]
MPGHKVIKNTTLLFSVLFIGACAGGGISDADKALPGGALNVIDASDLNDIMLEFADPEEAVRYFRNSAAQSPDRIDFKRGLAVSLVRAGKHAEAVLVYEAIAEAGQLQNEDRIIMADAYIRNGGWDEGQAQLNAIPPTYETYDRYRLEAIMADRNKQWAKADSFYDIARGLTTAPANTLNNWGFSKRIRGNLQDAEKLFRQALRADPTLFRAKANLVTVRAMRGEYNLPVIPMSDEERALLYYEAAKVAVDRGERDMARGLLGEAVDTHPRYFGAAVDALRALTTNINL